MRVDTVLRARSTGSSRRRARPPSPRSRATVSANAWRLSRARAARSPSLADSAPSISASSCPQLLGGSLAGPVRQALRAPERPRRARPCAARGAPWRARAGRRGPAALRCRAARGCQGSKRRFQRSRAPRRGPPAGRPPARVDPSARSRADLGQLETRLRRTGSPSPPRRVREAPPSRPTSPRPRRRPQPCMDGGSPLEMRQPVSTSTQRQQRPRRPNGHSCP